MLQLQPLKPGDKGQLDTVTGLLLANLLNAWAIQYHQGEVWLNSCPATVESAHWDWEKNCLRIPWGINGDEDPTTEFAPGTPFSIDERKICLYDQVYEFIPPSRW